MEGKERQPVQGGGHVILEVTNPRELKKQEQYKRGDVVSLQHSYPLRLMIPELASASPCRWIYPLTFGGGLVGGDVISISFHIKDHCAALVTSQESTKVYCCLEEFVSEQKLVYHIGVNAFLAVLGDPVVCFADARFKQTQTVNLTGSSNVVLLDWMTAGRMALEELWQFKSYQSLIEVYLENELVFRDNQHLSDTPAHTLQQAMKGYQVLGTCVVLGNDVQHLVTHLKKRYGRPHCIGEQLDTDVVCSYSPLDVETEKVQLQGCYLRFQASSTQLAFQVVKEITAALLDFFGADPYARKY